MKEIGKLVFLSLLIFCFSVCSVFAKDLSVSPFSVNIEWNATDTQPSDIDFIFINHDYTSFDVAVSKEGSAASFFTLSKTSMSFINNSASSLDLTFDIPSDTESGLYQGKINFDDEYIPVYIQVNQEEEEEEEVSSTGCKILITSGEYEYNKKKGTDPIKEEIYFKISKNCVDGIDVTDVRLDGEIIDTLQGKQPLRFDGAIPKGSYEPGDSFIVTLERDVNELEPQTYEAKLIIGGLSDEESIRQVIKFTVNVFGSSSSFSNINTITPPIYDPFPDTMVVNQSYAAVVRQVNPNIEIIFEPNEYLYCEPADISEDGTVIYKFRPIKEGETILKIYARYKGGPVGTPKVQNVIIKSELGASLGTTLKIQFFQDLTNLGEGETVSFLVKDNETDIILAEDMYSVYVNGETREGNSFSVSAGETYTVSISASGYKSIEQTFTVTQKTISVSISPEVPQLNNTVTVNTEEGANISLDGVVLDGNTFLAELGEHTLQVSKEGFQPNSLNFTVSIPTQFISTPLILDEDGEEIILKSGEELHFELNQPSKWVVEYAEATGSMPETQLEGETANIDFIPELEGVYYVRVTGSSVLWEGNVAGGGWITKNKWVIWAVILGGLAGLILYGNRHKLKIPSLKRKEKDKKLGYEFNP